MVRPWVSKLIVTTTGVRKHRAASYAASNSSRLGHGLDPDHVHATPHEGVDLLSEQFDGVVVLQ